MGRAQQRNTPAVPTINSNQPHPMREHSTWPGTQPLISHLKRATGNLKLSQAWRLNLALALLAVGLAGCAATPSGPIQVSRRAWGQADGKEVYLFSLRNTKGAEAL